MKKQKFRVGDRVYLPRRKREGIIATVRHQPGTLAPALKCRNDGTSDWGLSELKETYFYKVSGRGIPGHNFTEELIESRQPCPNCQTIGWDWISGCSECGLSPEDGR